MSLLEMVALCYILWCISIISVTVHSQPNTQGFVSLDCGIPNDHRYSDKITQIPYTSDVDFIDGGTNSRISPDYVTSTLPTQLLSLRSFPNGTRNCYALRSVTQGFKYLLRASFMHGNYDGANSVQNMPILFDLYLGVNLWKTISISDPSSIYTAEVLIVAEANSISVCLVKTGFGIPFISSLELRPLKTSSYMMLNASRDSPWTSMVLIHRLNAGSLPNQTVRYPDDPYDRIWEPMSSDHSQISISTTSEVDHPDKDTFSVPSAVLQTAVTPAAGATSLDFYWNSTKENGIIPRHYLCTHYAEITKIGPNASRIINAYINGDLWSRPFSPKYLLSSYVYGFIPETQSSYHFQLMQGNGSSLPPILNALEIYNSMLQDNTETNRDDVDAIIEIKEYYNIKRNWMGDPCAPKLFAWNGLNCSYINSAPPRIIALNLSSSSLTGEIHVSLGILKELKILDLSENNLTGGIPDFLAELTSLQLLNLSGNQFSGSIPPVLLSRSHNRSLILSLEANPGLCYNEGSCKTKKNTALILSVVISAVGVLTVVAFFMWRMRRRNQGLDSGYALADPEQLLNNGKVPLQESRQFTYVELEKITKNFQLEIGKGGFGTVYHGCLENGTQVAVKLRSQTSSQGSKELKTEAQVLTRVHHRNMVPLVGYCSDGNHMALVYEYMPRGSLEDHLKGNKGNPGGLCWEERLSIALETAQGLEYLHNGCKPPIIHRDVKAANILLNEKLEAKIADFGLSKSFHNDSITHVSTRVIGTRGYLDPEYYISSQLTEKSDVYSFGMVLLELITGQPVVLPKPEECHLRVWVQQRLSRGDITSLIDPRLNVEFDASSIWKIVDIAMKCTAANSTQRPTIARIVVQLKEALTLEAGQERSQDLSKEVCYTSDMMLYGIDYSENSGNLTTTGPMAR